MLLWLFCRMVFGIVVVEVISVEVIVDSVVVVYSVE